MLLLNSRIGILEFPFKVKFFSHEEYSCPSSVIIGCMLVPQIN